MPGWWRLTEARAEWLGLLLAVVTGGLLIGLDTLTLSTRLLLGVGWLLIVALLLRRGWFRLLGPLFFYDYLGTTRRNRFFIQRGAYGLALLGALYLVYARQFGDELLTPVPNRAQLARFAEAVSLAFLSVQLTAVLLITPIYAGSAIAEERQRRRLDFLLVTSLTGTEIVIGKLVSRLVSIGLLLMAGLPILALLQFLGGIDILLILGGFALTLLTMLSVGSVGILASAACQKPTNAIWLTYIVVLGYLCFCWCIPGINCGHPIVCYGDLEKANQSNQDALETVVAIVAKYALIHGSLTLFALGLAIVNVRPEAARFKVQQPPPDPDRLQPVHRLAPADLRPLAFMPQHPPVTDDPLLWRERNFPQDDIDPDVKPIFLVLGLMIAWLAALIVLPMLLEATVRGQPLNGITNGLARGAGAVLVPLILLAILFRASGGICRERVQGTLDSLLTLPIDWQEILWAKWLGSLLCIPLPGCVLAAFWLVALVTLGIHVLALPLLALGFLAHAGFIASLGLFLSVVSPNRLTALLRALLILTGLYAASLLWTRDLAGLTPMVAFWDLAFKPWDRCLPMELHYALPRDQIPTYEGGLAMTLVGMLLYALAAYGLWKLACRRLLAEKGEPPRSQLPESAR